LSGIGGGLSSVGNARWREVDSGPFIPVHWTARVFGLLGLDRAHDFMLRLAPLGPDECLDLLLRGTPGRRAAFLVRHRYLLLALVLIVPGNIVIGGGGGIAVADGMARLFSAPLYLVTVALATAPVPLAVYLTD